MRNSTCNLNLPSYFSLVMMSPCPLTPSMIPPSRKVHFTSLLPSRLSQFEKSLPSKRMIAPLGGGVDSASLRSSGLSALNLSSSFHGSSAAKATEPERTMRVERNRMEGNSGVGKERCYTQKADMEREREPVSDLLCPWI